MDPHARRRFLLFAALLAALPHAARAAGTPLKIGTLGAGRIGGTLGELWVKAGHPVMFSSRHPEELQGLVTSLGPLAQAGTVADAIAFADAVLLAVPYRALPEIGKEHAGALAQKAVVIDACNPFPGRDGEIAVWARAKGAGLATRSCCPARSWCAPSTPSATRAWRRSGAIAKASACRSRATTPKPSKPPRCSSAQSASSRC